MLIRAALGLACLAVVAGVAVTRWSTLLAGHPAYPVLLGAVFLVGVALLVTIRRTPPASAVRTAGRIAGALALTAVLAAVLWLRPHPADDGAVAATVPSSTVDVVSTPTAWELRPTRTEGAGVVSSSSAPWSILARTSRSCARSPSRATSSWWSSRRWASRCSPRRDRRSTPTA